ncbi:hypothetical protein EYC84_009261 [Monilinia fructicola]|uniref:Uncharacterized protein n=1 Tax=Monilinia fructicola TaxID=38448 RepID=A0A5M9JDM3_MONFR|nr:hypothetical protein EYC84_009261 [Monilinia fructicola]
MLIPPICMLTYEQLLLKSKSKNSQKLRQLTDDTKSIPSCITGSVPHLSDQDIQLRLPLQKPYSSKPAIAS